MPYIFTALLTKSVLKEESTAHLGEYLCQQREHTDYMSQMFFCLISTVCCTRMHRAHFFALLSQWNNNFIQPEFIIVLHDEKYQ